MITGEMRNKVDSIWDTIWTGGITSPITVLEQITYLMFMKLLDDNQLKAEANANLLGVPLKNKVFQDGMCVISENPRVETEYKNLRWNVFHNFEPGEMLTNIQTYVFPFIKTIGEGKDTAFSRYMKDTVFLIPTAKVLAKVVDGIDAMDMNNKDIMGDVYEYLLGKIAAAGENGQFRTPRHIINMMVELMQPTLKDSAGVSTAILIFTKTNAGGTENVWFYDMKADGYSLDDKRSEIKENDIPDIIARFHNREAEGNRERAEQSFFVPKQEIVDNGYDLSINKYKKVEYVAVEYPSTQEIMAKLRGLEKEISAIMDTLEGRLDG